MFLTLGVFECIASNSNGEAKVMYNVIVVMEIEDYDPIEDYQQTGQLYFLKH